MQGLSYLDTDLGAENSSEQVVENVAADGDGGGGGVHNVVVCTLCSCFPLQLIGRPPSWYPPTLGFQLTHAVLTHVRERLKISRN